ncbi:hypothetical protein M422DRAFT_37172 [Sphaerobolus stellatus SS14]|uniref:Uncharacterized protein n=1 Tax=Sphaerobolus stellatus (strain SS14) TaxID=990650 RepID=A0A0C9UJ13_SPHS4|nr:hypothetical protein M422DRAFT_37172 [Sphaerobolus stellatus SS14]
MGVSNQYHLYLLVNILGLVSISRRPEKCDQLFSITDDQLPTAPLDSVQDYPGSHRLLALRPTGSSVEG